MTRSDLTLKIETKFKRGWLITAQLALKRQEDYVKELRKQQENKKERENLKIRDVFRQRCILVPFKSQIRVRLRV